MFIATSVYSYVNWNDIRSKVLLPSVIIDVHTSRHRVKGLLILLSALVFFSGVSLFNAYSLDISLLWELARDKNVKNRALFFRPCTNILFTCFLGHTQTPF